MLGCWLIFMFSRITSTAHLLEMVEQSRTMGPQFELLDRVTSVGEGGGGLDEQMGCALPLQLMFVSSIPESLYTLFIAN